MVVFAVWRAHSIPVAVKMIAARTPMGAQAISIMTWLGEAELMRRLREHRSAETGLAPQHVVNLFGIGAHEARGEVQQYLVVMERLDTSLRTVLDGYLAKARQPPLEQALRWLLETARGVAECHEANVVHSDIKAANTLLSPRREAKIGDLGAGRVTRSISATASLAGSTNAGNARGSVLWLASELVDEPSSMPSKASDVYAWAVMAWEVLSCRLPYHGADGIVSSPLVSTRAAHAAGGRARARARTRKRRLPHLTSAHSPRLLPQIVLDINSLKNMTKLVMGTLRPDLAAVRPDAPPAVLELVKRCWGPEPRERPPIREVAETLGAVLAAFRGARQGSSEAALAAAAADAQSAAVKRAAAEAEAEDARAAAAELAALTESLEAARAARIAAIRQRRAEAEAAMRAETAAEVARLEAEAARELAEETRRAEELLERKKVALLEEATRGSLKALDEAERERLVSAFEAERAEVEAKVELARREQAARLAAQLAARRERKVREALRAAEAESEAERASEQRAADAALSARAAELLAPAEAARAAQLGRAAPGDEATVERIRAEFEAEREAVEARVDEARRAQRGEMEAALAERALAKVRAAQRRAEAEADAEAGAEARRGEAALAAQRAELLEAASRAHSARVRASSARVLGESDAIRIVAEFDVERRRVEAKIDAERDKQQRALEARLAARSEAKRRAASEAAAARARALDAQAEREVAAEAGKTARDLLAEDMLKADAADEGEGEGGGEGEGEGSVVVRVGDAESGGALAAAEAGTEGV